MTILKGIARSCFWIATVFYINSCNPGAEEISYLKSTDIQKTLDITIASVFASVPYPDYVTVYFAESEKKGYIFVTPHVSIENVRSKYYFREDKKLIIIGYQSEKMEKRFANLKSSRPEKVFNYTNNIMDIYDGKQVVFEILNDNNIQEITPTGEILELNDYGLIEFIPPIRN